jgi:hypothetical protein
LYEKELSVRPAQAAVPLSCSFLLPSGCAVAYLAWQFDLEWLSRPPLPDHSSMTTDGFFGP